MSKARRRAAAAAIGADASAGRVLQAALAVSVAALMEHEPGARQGDAEAVHQARVATRRLRSDLRTFAEFVDAEAASALRAELGVAGGALGAVRDADVLHERLARQAAGLPPGMGAGTRHLLTRLESERSVARGELIALLDSPRYAGLVESLVQAAAVPPLTPAADRPGRAATAAAVRRPWKRLIRAVAALGAAPPDEQLHAVRIKAKRVRYAAEAASAVWGSPATALAKQVARVQTVLGDLQDAAVAEAWLAGAATDAPSGVAAGALIAVQWNEAATARAAFPAAWEGVGRAKATAWLDRR